MQDNRDNDGMPGDLELLVQARENIDRYRKAKVRLRLVNSAGDARPGVTVRLRMLRHEFLFGIAPFEALRDKFPRDAENLSDDLLGRWGDFRKFTAELFNYATLPVYWGSYEAVDSRPKSEQLAALFDWCAAENMKTKAHPLIWCQSVPSWLPADFDELSGRMDRRIAELAELFGPASDRAFDFYDFLNEPTVQPFNFDNPLALWMQKLGAADIVEMAYDKCSQLDLPARGILNHFAADKEFLDLCLHLQEHVRPIRAVGLQSHQHSGRRPLWRFQQETDLFAAMLDIPVHWTENSVLSGESRSIKFVQGKADVPPWPSTADGLQAQAEALANQYTLLFGNPAVEAITQWNLTDATSWLGAPSGLLDEQLRPKPAYEALKELIRHQWWTDVTLTSDADGGVSVDAFKGDYELSIKSAEINFAPQQLKITAHGLKMDLIV